MVSRARSPGRYGDESVEVEVDVDVDVVEVDADVQIEVDVEEHAREPSAFDEAPTAVRTGGLGRPTNRAEQLRRLALVGMRVAEVAQRLDESTTALVEYAHVLGNAPATQPASPRAVAAIRQEAERCAALSRSVTELAVASDDRPAPVSAEALLREAVRLAQDESAREGRVALAALPSLPALVVRGRDVSAALGRIVRNALDATEGDGAIALAATAVSRRGRAGVMLSVTDAGAGIPAGDLAHIFEPFFTTRAKSGHAGLGLAVARAIVDGEGGQIEIESGAGRGTTVRIWLPLPEDRPERPRARSGTRVKRQP